MKLACSSLISRGVDKFVRGGEGGWDVVKCVYANNWIFSPQNTCTVILLDRVNLKQV